VVAPTLWKHRPERRQKLERLCGRRLPVLFVVTAGLLLAV
jgi:hypothetical protein